jgi:hypothetical protein
VSEHKPKHGVNVPSPVPGIDAEAVLQEGLLAITAWELAFPGSPNEHSAGLKVTECLATLNAEGRRGNLPRSWGEAFPPPSAEEVREAALTALYGRCVTCGHARQPGIASRGTGRAGALVAEIVSWCPNCQPVPS